jgi:glycosyltransferase involved in cell wall biosynthesis
MRVLVVLPTYQEAENIATVLRRVRAAEGAAHVLVVDDASPDGTADLALAVGEEIGAVDVLRRPGKAGLGSAYRDGFAWGLERGFEAFVEMDSDLSHDPAALPDLLAPLGHGADVVVGSRYVPGGSIPQWGVHRRALSRTGNVYAAVLLGLHVTDLTSGFRAYAAGILRRIDLGAVRADGYGFQIEMVYRAALAGGLVTEVPIRFVDRVEGRSKMSMRTIVEALALVTWWGATRVVGRRTASRTTEVDPGVGAPRQPAP